MKFIPYTAIFFLSLLGLLIFKQYYDNSKLSKQNEEYEVRLAGIVNKYETKVNELEQNVVLSQSINTSLNSKLAKTIDTLQYIKNLKSIVKYKTITKYKTDTIKIEVPYLETDSGSYLLLPFTFGQTDTWFSYKFTVNKDFVSRDELIFNDDFTVALGERDKGIKSWFKKPVNTFYISSKNPNSSVTEPKSVVVEMEKPKWFLGAGVSYTATKDGLRPGIGVMVGRKIL